MTPLLLSLLAIAAAPLLDASLRARPRAGTFADGLVQVVVGGILLVHVLPFGLAAAGWPALLALAGGALGGIVAHRVPGGERSAGVLAVVGLLLHSAIDGAALGAPHDHDEHGGAELLAWAVVLHTVPVGLATWRISRAAAGVPFAVGLLVATALATGGGWWAAEEVLHGASPAALGIAQCAVAGALLHVLGHVGDGGRRVTAGWGALVGVGVVALIAETHPIPRAHADELSAGAALVTLLGEAAPALLVGYLAAGVLHVRTPPALVARLAAGPGGALRGALLGAAVPVCGCEAVPAWRRLAESGASAGAGLAFLAAAPTLAAPSLLVSVALLGPAFTGVRIAATVGVAVVAAAVAMGVAAGSARRAVGGSGTHGRPPAAGALTRAVRFGFVDTVDHTAPWVLAGLGVAALAEPLLAPGALAGIPGPLAIGLAAVLGVPAYVCAAGAAPLVAVLLHKGVSTGAAVAFLVAGPAANVVALGALRRLEGAAAAYRFAGALLLGSVAAGLVVDALPAPALPVLHLVEGAPRGPVVWGSVAAVVALFAASLVRSGAPGFLEPLLHPHGPDGDEGHDHGGHRHAHRGHAHGGHRHADGHVGVEQGAPGHAHDAHDHDHRHGAPDAPKPPPGRSPRR